MSDDLMDNARFWEKYGIARNLDLVDARAALERLTQANATVPVAIEETVREALEHRKMEAAAFYTWSLPAAKRVIDEVDAALAWLDEQKAKGRGNSMNDEQPAPLWSDEDIANDAKRASSNPTTQATIRSCLFFMRFGYEAALERLTQANAELAAEVERLKAEGHPLPDDVGDAIAGLCGFACSPDHTNQALLAMTYTAAKWLAANARPQGKDDSNE